MAMADVHQNLLETVTLFWQHIFASFIYEKNDVFAYADYIGLGAMP